MKTFITIGLLICLVYPHNLYAEGKISYSGIPCKWSCSHESVDEVGPQKDDPVAARKDRQIMAEATRYSPERLSAIIERGDGRLLLLDPGPIQGR